MAVRIALVVTSHGRFNATGRLTGLWFGELASVYHQCLRAGIEPWIVSIRGGRVPLDPGSQYGLTGSTRRLFEDELFQAALERTQQVSCVDPDQVAGLYLAGGHGAMYDFADSQPLAHLVTRVFGAGRPVAAVCHGPAGLLGAQAPDGGPLVRGRRLTAFSWREERWARFHDEVPFSLEDALREGGARFHPAPLPLGPHTVRDADMITGANPASARRVGRVLLARVLGR